MNDKRSVSKSTYFRPPAAAEYLGLSSSTLAKMRLSGSGPIYSKASRRAVIYDVRDLESWIAENRRTSTSDPGAAR